MSKPYVKWGEVCPECNCLILTSGHHAEGCSRQPVTNTVDELDSFFQKLVKDKPELIEMLKQEREKLARSIPRLCPWGNCEICVDPVDNTIASTIGPVGCGCDFFPGWRSSYYEGLPKPGFAVKAYGRHGGRIARKRRATAQHERWLNELANIFKEA